MIREKAVRQKKGADEAVCKTWGPNKELQEETWRKLINKQKIKENRND